MITTIKEICQANGDKLIVVNIKKSYRALIAHDTKDEYYRSNLKECTDRYWAISIKHNSKLKEVTHVLGCVGGIVRCVIKVNGCHVQEEGQYIGRYVFEGEEQCDSPYLDKDIRYIFETLANFIHPKYYGFTV